MNGNYLPVTNEEIAATPRPVPLEPDDIDLYNASHTSLPPCPFCGSYPLTFGEIGITGIIGYTVACNIECGASVFANDIDRNKARTLAIQKWSKRIVNDTISKIVSTINDKTPLTTEHLLKIGFEHDDYSESDMLRIHPANCDDWSIYYGDNSVFIAFGGDFVKVPIKTNGEMAALCHAFGIELNYD